MVIPHALIDVLQGALVGGLIGYGTNHLAIWMLFHPYEEMKAFGRRLPFTPGLVVKNRERLADAVARVVTKQLIDSHALIDRLGDAPIEDNIEGVILAELETMTASPDSLSKLLGDDLESALDKFIRAMAEEISRAFVEASCLWLEKPDTIREVSDSLVRPMLDKPLGAWLDESGRRELSEVTGNFFVSILSGNDGRGLVNAWTQKALASLPDSKGYEHIEGMVEEYVEKQMPPLALRFQEALADYLSGPEFAAQAQGALAGKLHRMVVGKLPLAAMLIDERGIKEMLASRWPDVAADLAEIARGRSLETALMQALSAESERVGDGLRSFLSQPETLQPIAEWVSDEIPSLLQRNVRDKDFGSAIDRQVAEMCEEPLDSLMPNLDSKAEKFARMLAANLAKVMRDERVRSGAREEAVRMLYRLAFETPMGNVAGGWNRSVARSFAPALAKFLARRTRNVLKSLKPESLGIEAMVRERVMAFDPATLERIIYEVSRRELKAIIWVGGLLGVVAGAVGAGLALLI